MTDVAGSSNLEKLVPHFAILLGSNFEINPNTLRMFPVNGQKNCVCRTNARKYVEVDLNATIKRYDELWEVQDAGLL